MSEEKKQNFKKLIRNLRKASEGDKATLEMIEHGKRLFELAGIRKLKPSYFDSDRSEPCSTEPNEPPQSSS